jgi:hypothetical protein
MMVGAKKEYIAKHIRPIVRGAERLDMSRFRSRFWQTEMVGRLTVESGFLGGAGTPTVTMTLEYTDEAERFALEQAFAFFTEMRRAAGRRGGVRGGDGGGEGGDGAWPDAAIGGRLLGWRSGWATWAAGCRRAETARRWGRR